MKTKKPKPESRTDYAVRVKGTRAWCGVLGTIVPFARCATAATRVRAGFRVKSAIMLTPSLRGRLEIVPLRTRPLSVKAKASRRRTR
jgi:hypothetical protein